MPFSKFSQNGVNAMAKKTHYTGSSTANFTGSSTTAAPAASEGIFKGTTRVLLGSWTLSSDAAGTELVIGTVPLGSYILDIKIVHAALGGSVTLQVGDDDDDDRYITAASASSAGTMDIRKESVGYYITPASFSNNKDIMIKIAGAAASGDVTAYVLWAYPLDIKTFASAPGAAS